MGRAGPFCVGSTFDPLLFFVFKGKAPTVGTLTVHLVDIWGCGESGDMEKPCQGKFGEVCWFAMALRPVLCARVARKKLWKQSTQLKYASSLVWDDPQGPLCLVDLSSHIPSMM